MQSAIEAFKESVQDEWEDLSNSCTYLRGTYCDHPSGRIDATIAGPEGVLVPQNPLGVFETEFARTSFTLQEMI
jgi:hypothetical protein